LARKVKVNAPTWPARKLTLGAKGANIMRLSKEFAAWFKVPNDPDKAEFKIKHLLPGDQAQIEAATMDLQIEYQDGSDNVQKADVKPIAGKEVEFKLCVMDWKNVFDESGAPLGCNKINKLRILRGVENISEFITECREKLEKDFKKSQKDQEKT